LLNAPKLIPLAPANSKKFGLNEVAAALRQALSKKNTGLTSALATYVARVDTGSRSRSATIKMSGSSSHACTPLQSSVPTVRVLLQTSLKNGLNVLAEMPAPSPGGKPTFEPELSYHEKLTRRVSGRFA
jgi:hypothetical protein